MRPVPSTGRARCWSRQGSAAVVYALIEAPARGFGASRVVVGLVAGAVALIAFVFVERTARRPMVPVQLFRSRAFTGANVLTLLLYAALGGGFFFVPLDLIQVQHYSATEAGAALLPLALLLAALSRWSGGLVERHGGDCRSSWVRSSPHAGLRCSRFPA